MDNVVTSDDSMVPAVPRSAWGAVDPTSTEPLQLPVAHILFSWTGGERCYSRDDCIREVKQQQLKDMKRGLPDIQHNYLIGGDATVYEGRGFRVQATKDPEHKCLEGKSLDIAYIGDYTDEYPPDKMIRVAMILEDHLKENGVVSGGVLKIHWKDEDISKRDLAGLPTEDEDDEHAPPKGGDEGSLDDLDKHVKMDEIYAKLESIKETCRRLQKENITIEEIKTFYNGPLDKLDKAKEQCEALLQQDPD